MRCVLVDAFSYRNADRLAARLETPWVLKSVDSAAPDSALIEALSDADVAISSSWNDRLGRSAALLRLLQLPNAGTDAIDWSAVPVGCSVCNAFEHETAIAEYAMLAMLESRINLCRLDRQFRAGDWSESPVVSGPLHGELAGGTVGLIGYGRIGAALARRAAAFDMSVHAVSRRKPDDPLLAWSGDISVLDAMLPRCDFVVVACPLTEATRGLIGADRLRLMRPSAFLINVARGEIVDEDALFETLSSRRIAGAILDVWWSYPNSVDPARRPSRLPFWDLPNVMMTPHASAWTGEMLDRRWGAVARNLDHFARGDELENVVKRP